ncbi:MAG: hypothetical protein JKY60_11955 [Kordiimonadaceae bacterium]|nr:hypothetical protein [Kordiimonadaceae bacterium]
MRKIIAGIVGATALLGITFGAHAVITNVVFNPGGSTTITVECDGIFDGAGNLVGVENC